MHTAWILSIAPLIAVGEFYDIVGTEFEYRASCSAGAKYLIFTNIWGSNDGFVRACHGDVDYKSIPRWRNTSGTVKQVSAGAMPLARSNRLTL